MRLIYYDHRGNYIHEDAFDNNKTHIMISSLSLGVTYDEHLSTTYNILMIAAQSIAYELSLMKEKTDERPIQ